MPFKEWELSIEGLDVQNANCCCCVRQVTIISMSFIMDTKALESLLPGPFNSLSPALTQNGEKLHPMLMEELDLYSDGLLRQERGLIFLSASFKPDIKSTLLHSHSEITKASQQQGLPLGTMWLLGKFLSEQAPKQNINNLQHRLSLFLQLLLHFRRQTVLKDCRLLLLLETLLSTMTSNTLVS